MRMVWQHGDAAGPAGQRVSGAWELVALLAVLHRRAVAGGLAHAVVLSADGRLPRRVPRGTQAPAWAGAGPRPRLTVVVGADQTPLWWEPTGGGQQVSVGPRPATGPALDEEFTFYSGGQLHTIPSACLVPRELAWQATRMFLTGGRRPAIISWHALPPHGPPIAGLVIPGQAVSPDQPAPTRPDGTAAPGGTQLPAQIARFGQLAARDLTTRARRGASMAGMGTASAGAAGASTAGTGASELAQPLSVEEYLEMMALRQVLPDDS